MFYAVDILATVKLATHGVLYTQSVLSTYIFNRRRLKESNTTGVTSGEGTAYSFRATVFISVFFVLFVLICGPLCVI